MPPAQIVAGAAVTVSTGTALTVTVEVAEPVQVPAVPVTEYTVVEEGLTLMVFVVAPVLQLYVVAPLALRMVFVPAHMLGEFTVTPMPEPTVTVAVCVPVQEPLEPVTVYTVVEDGFTEMVFVVCEVLQV